MKRWLGLKKLVHEAVDRTTDLVEESHDLVASKTLGYCDMLGPIGEAARTVDKVRRATASGVFASIHGINRAVEAVTDVGMSVVADDQGKDEATQTKATPMRSDMAGRLDGFGDYAMGAVNGVIGDHLYETGNGLDVGFAIRYRDRYLPDDMDGMAKALPQESNGLVVFVHGLCCTELSWCIHAEEYYGDPETSFGSHLEEELGLTPLYVRYNTGRSIAESGAQLSSSLKKVTSAINMQGDVSRLALIGHSMGGLVIRNACHVARQSGEDWLEPLRHVVCLGTPHRGAPLEKLGSAVTSALRIFQVPGTIVPAKIIDARSQGIKDLRHGSSTEEIPLLEDVAYAFIAATVTEDKNHPLATAVGDMLVRTPSALEPAESQSTFPIHSATVGGVYHLELQNHPDVYRQIKAFLSGPP